MEVEVEDGVNTDDVLLITDSDEDQNPASSPVLGTNLTPKISSPRSSPIKSPVKEPLCSNTNQRHQENSSAICSICLEEWTNLGEHRICSLKCGHLFGLSCITRWIKTLKETNCPTCKKKATVKEIRNIYSKKLIAIDSSEVKEMELKLEGAIEEKGHVQIELTKSMYRERAFGNEVQELKNKINFLNSALERRNRYTTSNVKMYRENSLELCKEKGCRILSYYKNDNLIVASTKSSNPLFPGYGARKIDLATLQPTSYMPLHSNAIRDMQFHSENPWLLSASLDKTFKIIDTNSSAVIAVQNNNNLPMWSCCWDTNNTSCFFVGEQGTVVKYDTRRISQAIDTYVVPDDHSPVVSIASITAGSGGPLKDGGIISCKLNSLWAFGNKVSEEECIRHSLPIDPPFICVTYDNTKSQMLVSTRPTSAFPRTRHHIANLACKDNLTVKVSHCLEGSTTSKFLSRSCLLTHRGCSYAAAYQESHNMVCLWSTETGQRVSIAPAHNPILDLCSVNFTDFTYLFSLTESTFDFFKLQ